MNKKSWYPFTLIGLGVVWAASILYLITLPGFQPFMDQMAVDIHSVNRKPGQSPGGNIHQSKTSFSRRGDHWMVDFGSLSSFTVDETSMEEVIPSGNDLNTDPFEPTKIPVKKKNEIPAFIQALDGQKVEMVGFMIPLLTEKDKVLTFILAQSQMTCCYGIAPQLNQWIYVEMEKGKNTKWAMDVPITVSGILSVGKKYDKVNLGWSLYRMVSDNVELPKKGWF